MAQNSIGSAALVLSANTAKLENGLDKAAKKTSGFFADMSGNIGFMAAGPVGAIAALGSMLFQSAMAFGEQADAASKTAASLGIDTASFMGIAHAAKLSGVEAEALQMAFAKLNNTIGEGASGNAVAARTFEQLGLDAGELSGAGSEEAFKQVAEAISQIQDPMQQARLVTDLFGKSGLKLLPMFSDGAEGIKKAQEEAKRLGLTVSTLDAKNIEAMNDAISTTKSVLQGVAGKIITGIAPVLKWFADLATSVFAMLPDLTVPFILSLWPLMGVIAILGYAIKGILMVATPVFNFLKNIAIGFGSAISDVFNGILEVAQPVWDVIKILAVDTWRSITDGASPALDMFATFKAWLVDLGVNFDSFKGFALSCLQGISVAIAYLLDVGVNVAAGIINRLIIPVQSGLLSFARGLRTIATAMGRLPGAAGAAGRATAAALETLVETGEESQRVMQTLGNTLGNVSVGDSANSVNAFFNNLINRANQTQNALAGNPVVDPITLGLVSDLGKYEDKLRETIATVGMSAEEIERFKLAERVQTEMDRLGDALFEGRISWETYGSSLEALNMGNIDRLMAQNRRLVIATDITKAVDQLKEQIATMGMSATEIERWRLGQRIQTEMDAMTEAFAFGQIGIEEFERGMANLDMSGFDALARRRDEVEHFMELFTEGRDLHNTLQTPLEQFQTEMERLDEMLDAGAISWQDYERAVARAGERIANQKQDEIKSPSAQLKDSKEAVSTIITARLQQANTQESPEMQLLRIQQAAAALQRQQFNAAIETNRILSSQPVLQAA